MARRAGGVAAVLQVQRRPNGAAQIQSGQHGKVRVRLEHAEARRLIGNTLGRSARVGFDLGNSVDGTTANRLHSVVGIGGCHQGIRRTEVHFRRTRRVARRAGGVAAMGVKSQGTARMGVRTLLTDRRKVLDGSEGGHSPIALSDAAAAPGGAG